MAVRTRTTALIGLALLLIPWFLSSQAIPPPPDPTEEPVVVETEKTLTEGFASIEVQSTVPSTVVSINRVEVGYTIYDADSLAPGSYIIGASAPGYRPRELFIILNEKTRYTIRFTLHRITGYLSVEVEPKDAELVVDGIRMAPGRYELPVGTRTITLRRFGYVEKKVPATVTDGATTRLSVVLDRASFEVSGLRTLPPAFNPLNAGVLGRTAIGFSVSAPGSGSLVVRDRSGKTVAEKVFASFETWDQGFVWNGRDEAGKPLPDGTYEIQLEARPDQDASNAPARATTSVRIDSSILIRPLGALGASPGLFFFPDPEAQAAGRIATELCWIAGLDGLTKSAFGLDALYSIQGRASAALSAAAETGSSAGGSAALAASLSLVLAKTMPEAAVFVRGSWSDASSPLPPYPKSGLELALPLALPLGPARFGLAPGLFVDLSTAKPDAVPLLRSGFWVSQPSWQAGLSGEMRFQTGSRGISPAWPASASLQLRGMPLAVPFVGSAALVLQAGPGSEMVWSLGLGLGLLF